MKIDCLCSSEKAIYFVSSQKFVSRIILYMIKHMVAIFLDLKQDAMPDQIN